MTVALAALCGFPNDIFVIGAEDRMITSGDVQFEQPQPKMWYLGEHSVAMIYGLSAIQGAIAGQTDADVRSRGIRDVRSVADVYAWHLRAHVRHEAEADILAPLGLTITDLSRRPATVNQTMLNELSKQMRAYYDGSGLSEELGGALIIGTDATGAHIYQVEHGKARLMDGVGFVAAGGGQWHAASQFMFAGYTRWWSFPNALSLLYAAKKRAEVAPGVGAGTDLLIIPGNGTEIVHVGPESALIEGLEAIYQEHKKKMDADFDSQHARVKSFIDELIKPQAPVPPPPTIVVSEIPPTPPGPPKQKQQRKKQTPAQ